VSAAGNVTLNVLAPAGTEVVTVLAGEVPVKTTVAVVMGPEPCGKASVV
jgi:hypothetical protein